MSHATPRVVAAAALYFLAHSVLANDWPKARAAELLGHRLADALYRPFYLVQSVSLLALLVVYIRRQPGRDLYRAVGPGAWLMRGAQALVLAFLVWAALSVGLAHLTGSASFAAWWQEAPEVPRMPNGQEPSPTGGGTMRTAGPLGYTRHPLNWSLLALFWLLPRMTTRLLAFNLVLTAYIVLGSLHAESHMLRFYGGAYRDYQSRVPFFAPVP